MRAVVSLPNLNRMYQILIEYVLSACVYPCWCVSDYNILEFTSETWSLVIRSTVCLLWYSIHSRTTILVVTINNTVNHFVAETPTCAWRPVWTIVDLLHCYTPKSTSTLQFGAGNVIIEKLLEPSAVQGAMQACTDKLCYCTWTCLGP